MSAAVSGKRLGLVRWTRWWAIACAVAIWFGVMIPDWPGGRAWEVGDVGVPPWLWASQFRLPPGWETRTATLGPGIPALLVLLLVGPRTGLRRVVVAVLVCGWTEYVVSSVIPVLSARGAGRSTFFLARSLVIPLALAATAGGVATLRRVEEDRLARWTVVVGAFLLLASLAVPFGLAPASPIESLFFYEAGKGAVPFRILVVLLLGCAFAGGVAAFSRRPAPRLLATLLAWGVALGAPLCVIAMAADAQTGQRVFGLFSDDLYESRAVAYVRTTLLFAGGLWLRAVAVASALEARRARSLADRGELAEVFE